MKRYAILSGACELNGDSVRLQKDLVDFKNFLKTEFAGSWNDEEILVTGSVSWNFCQFLQVRLKEYDFVLVYRCNFSTEVGEKDFSAKIKSFLGEKCVFVNTNCDEIIEV